MMGPRQEAQAELFYEFSLEDHVPQNHLLRSIDRFAELSSIHSYLTDFYSHRHHLIIVKRAPPCPGNPLCNGAQGSIGFSVHLKSIIRHKDPVDTSIPFAHQLRSGRQRLLG